MKTLIILVLVAVLVAGMFLSKPSQDSFTAFLSAQNQPAQAQTIKDVGKEILGRIEGNVKSATLTYNDHGLWATEDLNGQPQYVGFFAHWWKKSAAAPAAAPAGN